MICRHFLTVGVCYLILVMMGLAAPVSALEGELLGQVHFKSQNLKLDKQSRREVSSIAAKINKRKARSLITLRGDFIAAKDEEEYTSKSVFMAREVEQHLKSLIGNRHDIYVMAVKAQPTRNAGVNLVSVYLFPQELKVDKVLLLRMMSAGPDTDKEQKVPLATETSPADQGSVSPVVAGKEVSGESLSQPVTAIEAPPEDAKKAEELVQKAKERAASRARRLAGSAERQK